MTIGNFASLIRGAEILRAEVEFVVAGRHHVDAHLVQDVDLWAPLSMPERSDGESVSPEWTKKVVPFGALALDDGCELGEAAAAVVLLHPVDVVRLHEPQRYRFRQGRRGQRGESDGEEGGFSVWRRGFIGGVPAVAACR